MPRFDFVPPMSPARIMRSSGVPAAVPAAVPPANVARSQGTPAAAVTCDDFVGRLRAMASRRIIGKLGRFGVVLPGIEDRIHERPRGFDTIGAIEERGLAANTIVDQCGIGDRK